MSVKLHENAGRPRLQKTQCCKKPNVAKNFWPKFCALHTSKPIGC